MTKDETVRFLDWLTNVYPRQYSPNMTQQRRTDLLDTFYDVFKRHAFSDVKEACLALLEDTDDAPSVKAILAQIRGKRTERSTTGKAPLDLSKFPDDHPYKGCYYHEEALAVYLEDQKAGKLNGRMFRDYCKMYPAIAWRPWSNVELNRDRLEGGEWSYVLQRGFKGWTVNANGFCVPK